MVERGRAWIWTWVHAHQVVEREQELLSVEEYVDFIMYDRPWSAVFSHDTWLNGILISIGHRLRSLEPVGVGTVWTRLLDHCPGLKHLGVDDYLFRPEKKSKLMRYLRDESARRLRSLNLSKIELSDGGIQASGVVGRQNVSIKAARAATCRFRGDS